MNEENRQTPKKYYDQVSVGNRTKQIAYFVQQHDKNRMFFALQTQLEGKQVLVLVKSKRSGDELVKYLDSKEIKALSIHGNHRDSEVEEAQNAFNTKEVRILITTDRILEKLALFDVNIVVNYDLPFEIDDYFKRLRLVDEIGLSISLIDPVDEKMLAGIELMMKCDMDEQELEGFEYTKRPEKEKKEKKPRHKKVQQKAKKKAKKKEN
ncbi:helicase-related protein [Sulfurimonas sp.]